jgi:hypothetical protein
MEAFVIETIKKYLIKVNLPSIFCIYKNNKAIYNNGISIDETYIDTLKNINTYKNMLYLNGLRFNDNKFVVVSIDDFNDDIFFVHSKAQEEGVISIIGQDYTLFIYYDNEYLPMLHSLKIDKLKNNMRFINRLLI